jgi:hypothetical protein
VKNQFIGSDPQICLKPINSRRQTKGERRDVPNDGNLAGGDRMGGII